MRDTRVKGGRFQTETLPKWLPWASAFNPSEENIRLGPLALRFLIAGEGIGGAASRLSSSASRREAPCGAGAQPRRLRGDDLWHPGRADLDRRGTSDRRGPGQALCIPRCAIHRFDNNGGQDAKVLCVVTPAGPQFLRDSAETIDPAAGGPSNPVKIAAIKRAHGLTPAAPPPSA